MGPVRDRQGLRVAEPVAELLPDPDAGPERRDPIVRDPVTVRIGGRGAAVSTAIEPANGEPERRAHRRGDADAGTDAATTDTDPDTGADAASDTGSIAPGIGPARSRIRAALTESVTSPSRGRRRMIG